MLNVLMSTYNGERYIEEQLKSIFEQTYKDFHLYIRDDGSVDNTVQEIKDYVKENRLGEKVTFVVGENIGFCKSFFELLSMSKCGDYWAFCDQDDYWYPDKLKLSVQWMEGKEDKTIPLLYHSGFEVGNQDFSEKTVYKMPKIKYDFYQSLVSNIFFGFSMVINKPLYDRLIMANPDVIKYHDWFAAMITAAFGYHHISNQVMAIHRQHEDNSSPLYFFKKIPDGLKLLGGDNFYTRNAREFKRLFGEELSAKEYEVLEWFQNEEYSFGTAIKKAFYPHRWNPQLPVELALRLLMLIGRI